jgi:hypothetical protein
MAVIGGGVGISAIANLSLILVELKNCPLLKGFIETFVDA